MICTFLVNAQEPVMDGPQKEWRLKLRSTVELRTWKLSTKAEKTEEPLMGATILLLKGKTVIQKSATNVSGEFEMLVPANDEFILEVSYAGCNTKRFFVSTLGVPADVSKESYFKPSFSIGGFVMAKPFPGIDYSGLQQTLVKVVYEHKLRNFDDDESYTEVGLGIVSKIADAENILIEKFCSTNRAGDAALVKPDCPLAKKLYNEAIALIPGEQYPVVQLAKVGDCLKAKEEEAKKAADEAAAKLAKQEAAKAEQQAAKEKAEADKLAKANEKAAADKVKAEKAAAKKAEADKAAKEKAEADKLAKAAQKSKAKEPAKAEPVKEKPPIENTKETNTHQGATSENETEYTMGKHDAKKKVPQPLGQNKYKEALNKAEGYFKMKRYSEAKPAYEEVLKIKPDDAYSKNKLAEIEKLLNK